MLLPVSRPNGGDISLVSVDFSPWVEVSDPVFATRHGGLP